MEGKTETYDQPALFIRDHNVYTPSAMHLEICA